MFSECTASQSVIKESLLKQLLALQMGATIAYHTAAPGSNSKDTIHAFM